MNHVKSLLTRRDIAFRLGVNVRTVDRWISQKKLEIVKIGRLIRVTEDSFNKLLQENTIK